MLARLGVTPRPRDAPALWSVCALPPPRARVLCRRRASAPPRACPARQAFAPYPLRRLRARRMRGWRGWRGWHAGVLGAAAAAVSGTSIAARPPAGDSAACSLALGALQGLSGNLGWRQKLGWRMPGVPRTGRGWSCRRFRGQFAAEPLVGPASVRKCLRAKRSCFQNEPAPSNLLSQGQGWLGDSLGAGALCVFRPALTASTAFALRFVSFRAAGSRSGCWPCTRGSHL